MDSNRHAAAVVGPPGTEGSGPAADGLGALAHRLHGLDEEHRIVVALYYLEGLSGSEVAQVLDVPEAVAGRIFAEAMARLRAGAAGLGERAA